MLVIALVVVYLRKQHRARSVQRNSGASAQPGMPVRTSDRGELEQFLSRARNSGAESPKTPDGSRAAALAPRLKAILWSLLAVLLVAGSIGSYLHWRDQQRLVTVLLHRDASQAPVIYRVAKRDLGVNSFITEDGTQVTVSANERMEVVGL